MRKIIDPFLYSVHSIDIHGYDALGAVAVIKIFIDNEARIGSKKVLIIHGKGQGILLKATHDYLKKDKRVIDYQLDMFNDGQTIVSLK